MNFNKSCLLAALALGTSKLLADTTVFGPPAPLPYYLSVDVDAQWNQTGSISSGPPVPPTGGASVNSGPLVRDFSWEPEPNTNPQRWKIRAFGWSNVPMLGYGVGVRGVITPWGFSQPQRPVPGKFTSQSPTAAGMQWTGLRAPDMPDDGPSYSWVDRGHTEWISLDGLPALTLAGWTFF